MTVKELSELELALMVDRLADVIQKRKELEEQEKQFKNAIKQNIDDLPADVNGVHHVARVEERRRYTIPKEVVREKLGDRMVNELQRCSYYVTINIK